MPGRAMIRERRRRIPGFGLMLCGALLAVPGAVSAQSGHQVARDAGLRTLTWAGRPATPPSASAPAAGQRLAAPNPVSGVIGRPLEIQPAAMPDYAAAAPRFPDNLTPATAFGAAPVINTPASGQTPYQPQTQPQPQIHSRASADAPPATRQSVQSAPPPSAPPPAQVQNRAPAPQQQPTLAPADPNAPRPDAPIFRMGLATPPQQQGAQQAQQQAQQPAPQQEAGRDGARYYSVHRAAGREPDPTTLPAPFFLDHAPVDLAEPPPAPTLMRNQRGLAPSVADTGL